MDSSLIPTLSQLGLVLLAVVLGGAGAWMLVKRPEKSPSDDPEAP